MDLDPVLLSRLQFAWVIGWHILLPAFTVGTGLLHRDPGGLALRDRPGSLSAHLDVLDPRSSRWPSAWAWCPASSCRSSSAPTGAASPTPPPTSSSPLFAYEGLTAFFLEAAFLGVLLFGRKLVPPLGAFRCRPDGGLRHAVLVVLDPGRQQLDADAGRLRD